MSIKFIFSFFIMMAMAGILNSSQAVPCPNKSNIYKGSVFFADQQLDSLTISGLGNLQSSTILGRTVVIGPFNGKSCVFQDMEITGPLTLTDSSLHQAKVTGPVKLSGVQATGPLVVIGTIEAMKSELQDIVIQTRTLTLSDSKVGSVKIKADRSDAEPQRLYLTGKTTVSGVIEFERGDGIVVISGPHVLAEKIIGAKVERS